MKLLDAAAIQHTVGSHHEFISAALFYISTAKLVHENANALLEATNTYIQFGKSLGKTIYAAAHPNPLGKMVYYQKDFVD